MKFSETVIDKKLEDFKFTEKYVTVYIESPDVISYPDTVSMIMRCDDVFSYGSGNDKDYVKFIRVFAGMPQKLPDWVRNRVPKNYYDILEKQYTKELEAFNKKWNRNPSEYSPIFKVGLFCTCWANGPHSFVNLKTGKVQGYSVLGKWPGNVSECKEEMEWFTKLYPDYKFFLTFVDTDVLCTLMLYKGEIKVVKTRTEKELQHCSNVNHLKGSTGAKSPNFLYRFLDNLLKNSEFNSFRWKVLWHITSIPMYLWYRPRNWFFNKIVSKCFPEWYNEFQIVCRENFESSQNEKYFDKAHAKAIIRFWLKELK